VEGPKQRWRTGPDLDSVVTQAYTQGFSQSRSSSLTGDDRGRSRSLEMALVRWWRAKVGRLEMPFGAITRVFTLPEQEKGLSIISHCSWTPG
jgi:hypothetical protein